MNTNYLFLLACLFFLYIRNIVVFFFTTALNHSTNAYYLLINYITLERLKLKPYEKHYDFNILTFLYYAVIYMLFFYLCHGVLELIRNGRAWSHYGDFIQWIQTAFKYIIGSKTFMYCKPRLIKVLMAVNTMLLIGKMYLCLKLLTRYLTFLKLHVSFILNFSWI